MESGTGKVCRVSLTYSVIEKSWDAFSYQWYRVSIPGKKTRQRSQQIQRGGLSA